MKYFSHAAIFVATFWVTAWLYGGQRFIGPSYLADVPTVQFSYSDFLSVTLTALGLILAALAIVIGVVAFKTISEIKEDARDIAKAHSEEIATKRIDLLFDKAEKNGEFDAALERAIAKMNYGGGQWVQENGNNSSEPNQGEN